ncbi:MAG TPA: redoxin domain-containing protein, partial [Elusimicrobiota bacterium]|nr:redoxin domain-containing protein [Elusimicrobiota bacterium]
KKKIPILGVSTDTAKSHAGFKAKHGLPFPLLVDEDKEICRAYGVWKSKVLYGRRFMGVERSTFVIGPDGKIKEALRKVSVAGHAQALLENA